MKIFNQVAVRKPKRSLFDLSHEKKLSTNLGVLTPVMCEEVLPGDKFKVNSELLARLQPLQSPVMHRMDIYTHFFFVPNRIIWSNWEKFITGGVDGNDTPLHPYIKVASNANEMKAGQLADYLGYGTVRDTSQTPSINYKLNALPFAAYQKIVDDYFIDLTANQGTNMENYQLVDGENATALTALMSLRLRSWQKDYFTSSLPFTQRGGEVGLPVGGQVPVKAVKGVQQIRKSSDGTLRTDAQHLGYSSQGLLIDTVAATQSYIDPNNTLYADLNDTSMTTGSIEELRRAARLQEWLEKAARGGSRYVESIASFFGVRVPDYRLQRAEYLGGGKSPVVISEVLQTSGTTSPDAQDPLYNSPLGDYAGHGVSVGNVHGFRSSFNEHGWIIGILSIMPKPAYMQGFRRFFIKESKFDYAFPDFSQLGEQPVYLGELYNDQDCDDTVKPPTKTFAYQSRYAEYKYSPNTVHGDFKTSLDFWHMARKFASEPAWNNTFIKYQPDDRIFANTTLSDHKFLVQIFHNVRAIRPLPYYNIPKL